MKANSSISGLNLMVPKGEAQRTLDRFGMRKTGTLRTKRETKLLGFLQPSFLALKKMLEIKRELVETSPGLDHWTKSFGPEQAGRVIEDELHN
jgi:hypothetical protein